MLDDLEAAHEQVAEAVRGGRRAPGRIARSSWSKTALAFGRTLKSPPKISGAEPANSTARSAAVEQLPLGGGRLRADVEVRDAEARLEAGQGHDPELGPAGEDHPAALGDPAGPAADQGGVRAALPGAEQVRAPAPDQRGERLQPVAAAEGAMGLARRRRGPGARFQLGGNSWKRATSQSAASISSANSVEQVPVRPARSSLPGCGPAAPVALVGAHLELGLGRPVAAVEQVPCHCGQLHARSIGGSMTRRLHSPRAISSPARSSTASELIALLERAAELKAGRERGEGADSLAGRSVALDLREALDPHPGLVRGRRRRARRDADRAARRRAAADAAASRSRTPAGSSRATSTAIVIRSGSDERVARAGGAARACR